MSGWTTAGVTTPTLLHLQVNEKPLEERTIEEQRVCLQSTSHQDVQHHFQGCPKQSSAKLESNLSTHELWKRDTKQQERWKCQLSRCPLQISPILLRVIFPLEMRKQAWKNTKSYPSFHREALWSPGPHQDQRIPHWVHCTVLPQKTSNQTDASHVWKENGLVSIQNYLWAWTIVSRKL